ncbi:MAG: hypothetical protein WA705_22690 [Candidatus Ozemobacteraceae bacterium]
MKTSAPRLLLIHTTSERSIRYGSLFRSAGRSSPLGLAMLQALSPGRIDLLDLQEQAPDLENIDQILASSISACLVQAPQSWDDSQAQTFGEKLRAIFPQARLVLGGRTDFVSIPAWDHTLLGTGRTLVNRLLSGENPVERHLSTLTEDMRIALPIPQTALFDGGGYRASSEKMYQPSALSIYRPWLGFLDRSRIDHSWAPSQTMLEALLSWLRISGFKAFSFEGPGIKVAHLPALAESLARLGLSGAVALDEMREIPHIPLPLGPSLRRLWLRPSPWEIPPDGFAIALARLREDRIAIGLRLHPQHALAWVQSQAGDFIDQISLQDPGNWPKLLLRRTLFSFFGKQGRFFSLLSGIRSAHDLVRFLQGSYGLFELLFERNTS